MLTIASASPLCECDKSRGLPLSSGCQTDSATTEQTAAVPAVITTVLPVIPTIVAPVAAVIAPIEASLPASTEDRSRSVSSVPEKSHLTSFLSACTNSRDYL